MVDAPRIEPLQGDDHLARLALGHVLLSVGGLLRVGGGLAVLDPVHTSPPTVVAMVPRITAERLDTFPGCWLELTAPKRGLFRPSQHVGRL